MDSSQNLLLSRSRAESSRYVDVYCFPFDAAQRLALLYPFSLVLNYTKEFTESKVFFRSFVKSVLANRSLEERKMDAPRELDFLDILLKSDDTAEDEEIVLGNLMLFIIAGHDSEETLRSLSTRETPTSRPFCVLTELCVFGVCISSCSLCTFHGLLHIRNLSAPESRSEAGRRGSACTRKQENPDLGGHSCNGVYECVLEGMLRVSILSILFLVSVC